LAEGGWFCEIGKRDIYSNTKIGMYALRKNITITAVDTDRLPITHPHIAHEATLLFVDLIAKGKLPPIPIEVYPLRDYIAAFRKMQQGKHTGKLVFDLRDATPIPVVDHRPLFSPHGTYIVTGGLGGFGLHLLRYLYLNGARNLLLADSDSSRGRSVEWVTQKARLGNDTTLVIEHADVAKYDDVEKLVKLCGSKLPPLTGVFHLAGVMIGGSILSQNTDLYPPFRAMIYSDKQNISEITWTKGSRST
jgi:hypothetical protein